MAESLSQARRENALRLKEGLEGELSELGMKGAAVEVAVEAETAPDGTPRLTAKGMDRVSFLISTNPGEELKPLAKIASGGELARIMLAMKSLTAVGKVPTLIFDEVDTGVGAPMSQVLGRKLKGVAANHQVLCVTHTAQIAAFADNHYYVAKAKNKEGRTVTRVGRLGAKDRAKAIAVMLAGEKVTETSLKQARELLEAAGGAAKPATGGPGGKKGGS